MHTIFKIPQIKNHQTIKCEKYQQSSCPPWFSRSAETTSSIWVSSLLALLTIPLFVSSNSLSELNWGTHLGICPARWWLWGTVPIDPLWRNLAIGWIFCEFSHMMNFANSNSAHLLNIAKFFQSRLNSANSNSANGWKIASNDWKFFTCGIQFNKMGWRENR